MGAGDGGGQGKLGLNPPSELRSVGGSSRNAPKSRRGPDPIGTAFRAGSTVVIKRLGDMPDGPRRARLSADPRAELINNCDISLLFGSPLSLSLSRVAAREACAISSRARESFPI